MLARQLNSSNAFREYFRLSACEISQVRVKSNAALMSALGQAWMSENVRFVPTADSHHLETNPASDEHTTPPRLSLSEVRPRTMRSKWHDPAKPADRALIAPIRRLAASCRSAVR